MEVSVEVRKIIKCAIYSTVFPSGGGVDGVLVRILLIEQIIKGVNLICISFSVKHLQIFYKTGTTSHGTKKMTLLALDFFKK